MDLDIYEKNQQTCKKKTILADLELEDWEFLLVKYLLIVLKKKLRKEDNKLIKVTKFKQVKQDL